MSKAEDRYLDLFLDGRLRNCSRKYAFLLGYQQAEKDLELTWEDIRRIYLLVISVSDMQGWKGTDKSIYQEVLKRFKNLKK